MLFLYRRFLAQRTFVRFSVSLRLGHTRGKTVINAFLTRSCRYATSADDFCSKSSKPHWLAMRALVCFDAKSPSDSAAVFEMLDVCAAHRGVRGESVGVDLVSIEKTPKVAALIVSEVNDVVFGNKSVNIALFRQEIFVFGEE